MVCLCVVYQTNVHDLRSPFPVSRIASDIVDIFSFEESIPGDVQMSMGDIPSDARQRILQARLDEAKAQGIEIPRSIKCKICCLQFPNPIFHGSSIISVVCQTCKDSIIDKYRPRRRRKKSNPDQGLGEEGSLTRPPPTQSKFPNSLAGWMS